MLKSIIVTFTRLGNQIFFVPTLIATTILASTIFFSTGASASSHYEVAVNLAELLRSARTVISRNQNLINSITPVNKALTGKSVIDQTSKIFKSKTGLELRDFEDDKENHLFLDGLKESIREVVDEHQSTINKADIGFKGFVPAVFARLVNERFKNKFGNKVVIKVTAPRSLVRNRKALPDAFETEIIRKYFSTENWPKNKIYSELTPYGTGKSLRVLVPEYYNSGCLSCHGEPKGDIDITGYPKEGGTLDQLGGVISIQFFE